MAHAPEGRIGQYEAWRRVLDERRRSLAVDHRRYNSLLLVGVLLAPFLLIWSKVAAVAIGAALTLAFVGHYVALMYGWDYERQQERLDADLAHFADETSRSNASALEDDRVRFDAVRVPRRGALPFPFSKR